MPNNVHRLTPCYGHDTIETWRRRGATSLELWCVGNPKCHYWYVIDIETAIEKWEPGTSLVMLARRARCQKCGQKGCHVQPSSRLPNGKYNWGESEGKHLVETRPA